MSNISWDDTDIKCFYGSHVGGEEWSETIKYICKNCFFPKENPSIVSLLQYGRHEHTLLLQLCNQNYYMEESVFLGTKPLVDSIRHSIRDPSGVLSV